MQLSQGFRASDEKSTFGRDRRAGKQEGSPVVALLQESAMPRDELRRALLKRDEMLALE
jgi:hypothetical protein